MKGFQNFRPLAFKLEKSVILTKMRKNLRKSPFCYLEKGALELCLAATTKPREIEHSGFFLLDHNRQTRVYRLVLGQTGAEKTQFFDGG